MDRASMVTMSPAGLKQQPRLEPAQPRIPRGSRKLRALLVTTGVACSVFLFYLTQVSMLASKIGWSWSAFRVYYDGDQLVNLAMVVNGANGNLASVEPFTETGTNNDPHLYLQILGEIARITGAMPSVVYNVGGIAVQGLLVASIAIAAALFTRRWWASFFGAVPFLIGTLSFTGSGWFTTSELNGILWGAFGAMFALNSASAALAIAAGALLGILVLAQRASPRVLLIAGTVAGAILGLDANVDTYTFIIAAFFALYGLSFYVIASSESRSLRIRLSGLSIALIVLLFLVGRDLATWSGHLGAFAIGLLPACPGLLTGLRRWRERIVLPVFAMGATAAPQIVGVIIAIHDHNPFLIWREGTTTASSVDVTWGDAVHCAVPLLIPLVLIFIAGLQRRHPLWIAYASGALVAWLLGAKNDMWGANQEPYQFWIDGFALVAFTIIPVFVDVVITCAARRATSTPAVPLRWRVVVGPLAVVAVAVAAWSSVDWYRFYRAQEGQTISLATAEDLAMKRVASAVSTRQLIVTDPCISPEIFKDVTAKPVDYYSAGLAWPARVSEINAANNALNQGTASARQLAAAGIGWLVADHSCQVNWPKKYAALVKSVASSRFGPARNDVITLWRFKAQPTT